MLILFTFGIQDTNSNSAIAKTTFWPYHKTDTHKEKEKKKRLV